MEREKFKSRIGFIMISAGCAIGVGNVWRFPYVVGENGGAIFVLIYITFLIILGVPVLTMELALGRSSRKSIVCAYKTLEKPKSKWHYQGYVAMIANYVLMMFYTVVTGWMLYYFFAMLTGKFEGATTEEVVSHFGELTQQPVLMAVMTIIVIALGFAVCSLGLQKGVERVTKVMMISLLLLMILLAANSLFLKGGKAGIEFYLKPDISSVKEHGIINIVVAAMNQAFFTLSLGIGSIAIFGSYMDKDRALLGEAVTIAGLDTFVAIMSGLIIFPACFTYGVSTDSGPSLIFITLPNIFAKMPGGRIWGSLFFLFMTFAAFSTVIAVFENIISFAVDLKGIDRKKSAIMNFIIVAAGSMPCVLGFNQWSGFAPFGKGSNILDLEDFLVSNVFLPVGALILVLFCSWKIGWGYDEYKREADTGKGMKLPGIIKPLAKYVIPVLVIFVFVQGIMAKFF